MKLPTPWKRPDLCGGTESGKGETTAIFLEHVSKIGSASSQALTLEVV
jgi:hypothetical protein